MIKRFMLFPTLIVLLSLIVLLFILEQLFSFLVEGMRGLSALAYKVCTYIVGV